MRENIELFKESVHTLTQKNSELEKRCVGQPSPSQMQQMNALFQGLKEDNERLAHEITTLTKDNQILKDYVENQKMILREQSGIIKGLQSVLETQINKNTSKKTSEDKQTKSLQRLNTRNNSEAAPNPNDIIYKSSNMEDTGTFLDASTKNRVSRFT